MADRGFAVYRGYHCLSLALAKFKHLQTHLLTDGEAWCCLGKPFQWPHRRQCREAILVRSLSHCCEYTSCSPRAPGTRVQKRSSQHRKVIHIFEYLLWDRIWNEVCIHAYALYLSFTSNLQLHCVPSIGSNTETQEGSTSPKVTQQEQLEFKIILLLCLFVFFFNIPRSLFRWLS